MSTIPVVSIVIPTYNAEPWLEEAVRSALSQTLTDIEVLVFDNASTDATPDLMARISDPRLSYFRAAENIGFAGNVTRGIEAARGRYFLVLGADDVLKPTFLAEAVALLDADPAASMLHGRAIWIDDDGAPIGVMRGTWPAKSSGEDAFLRTFTEGFCYSTVISRTEHVKRLQAMDERWGMISDSWLFLKMCLAGEVLFLDTPLVLYRVRDSSLSFELYADGKMFNDHLMGLEQAFSWPEAAPLRPRAREARLAVALQAFDTMHMTRIGAGLSGMLAKSWQVTQAVPGILLSPRAWLRFAFALLPATTIQWLRNWRRTVAIDQQ
ncbi:glycosyltransferase family 2 protein [Ruegeria marina]|uniref:Glycosyl transferase family 2 n=1 Tax=Ruegeria marina TaxID=639004 RepID=A0A1G6VLG3_9RHOB|nr:glycosyltransferase family 2 protein [Ruegeria marina]SDD54374.1 Glycosyl transferase family 2 [Ruegeria marina]